MRENTITSKNISLIVNLDEHDRIKNYIYQKF